MILYFQTKKKRILHWTEPCKKPFEGYLCFKENDQIYESDNYESLGESQSDEEIDCFFTNKVLVTLGPSKTSNFKEFKQKIQDAMPNEKFKLKKIYPQLQDPKNREIRLVLCNFDPRLVN